MEPIISVVGGKSTSCAQEAWISGEADSGGSTTALTQVSLFRRGGSSRRWRGKGGIVEVVTRVVQAWSDTNAKA
jgi:hypothetical protein